MRPSDNHTVDRESKKQKYFFGGAFLCAFLLSLVWSLDSSFVYVLFGMIVFFLFLGIQSVIAVHDLRKGSSSYSRKTYQHRERSSSFSFDEWLKQFARQAFDIKGQHQPYTDASRKIAVVAIGLSIVIVIAVFVGVFIVVGTEEDESVYVERATSYYNNGNYDSATLNYRLALQLNKERSDIYQGLANVKYMQKQFDSSLYFYDKALEADRDYLQASYGKAYIYYERQDYDRLMDEVHYILKRDQQYSDALLLAGDGFYIRKQYDSAMYYYDNAYLAGARSVELLHIMGYLHEVKGNKENAIRYYKEALSYNPDNDEIKSRLTNLEPGAPSQDTESTDEVHW